MTAQQIVRPRSCVEPPPGVNANQAAISLMAMAETFRAARRYKMAIKCCQTALRVPSSPELFALCSYELGKLLWLYTRNEDIAQFHLGQSLRLMRQLGPPLEQARLKCAALLAELLLARRLFPDCLEICKTELSDSARWPTLHTKLLFLYAEAQLRLVEFARALEAVQAGIQFSRGSTGGGVLVECYFRLVKSLILSIQMTDQQELGKSVGELGEILQSVAANGQDQAATNDIHNVRAYCYAIQLCYFLAAGMVKSSKQCLRQLHITVQAAEEAAKSSVSPNSSACSIRWLSPEMLTGFAYVLTVLCNIHYSNFERAQRYHGTAIKHLESMRVLMRKSSWPVLEARMEEFASRMEMLLHEGMAQMQLVRGSPSDSLTALATMIRAISGGGCIARQPAQLLQDFGPQMHTLLGFYAANTQNWTAAERQFRAALKVTKEPELWTMANLSLALIYLWSGVEREADFYELFEAISPSKLRSQANSVRSAAFLVQGFHYFLNSRQQECKKHLMDSITISKEEDMVRLQSMALLLLAKLLRSNDVLKAAYEWANKSNDAGLLLWANSEVFFINAGNSSEEEIAKIAEEMRDLRERLGSNREASKQMAAHQLIQWTDGDVPSEAISQL